MALDVRETYLRDRSVHSYFSRVLLDALSVPPLGQVLVGFGEVFGRPKTSIFILFDIFGLSSTPKSIFGRS